MSPRPFADGNGRCRPGDTWRRLAALARHAEERPQEAPSEEWTERLLTRWRVGEGRAPVLSFEDAVLRVALPAAAVAAGILLLVLASDVAFSVPDGSEPMPLLSALQQGPPVD